MHNSLPLQSAWVTTDTTDIFYSARVCTDTTLQTLNTSVKMVTLSTVANSMKLAALGARVADLEVILEAIIHVHVCVTTRVRLKKSIDLWFKKTLGQRLYRIKSVITLYITFPKLGVYYPIS